MRIPLLAGIAVGLGPDEGTTDAEFYFEWSSDSFQWGYEIAAASAADPSATVDSSIVDYRKVVDDNYQMMFYWACLGIRDDGTLTSAILVDFTSDNKTIAHGYVADGGKQPPEIDLPSFPGMSYAVVVGCILQTGSLTRSK